MLQQRCYWPLIIQFGHLFAKGRTREAAIRAMVVALKEIKIRGEIHHICDYVTELLQDEEFLGDAIHTGWLDSRIAAQVCRYFLCFCVFLFWGGGITAAQMPIAFKTTCHHLL